MKKVLLFLIAVFNLSSTIAQKSQRNYPLAISRFQKYYNEKNADSLYAMYSERMQYALPLVKTKDMLNTIHQQVGQLRSYKIEKETEVNMTYRGIFEKAELFIVIALNPSEQLGMLLFQPVKNEETKPVTLTPDSSNFNIQTIDDYTIYGTLQMPKQAQVKPSVVLIIAGSGPTDRNCNSDLGFHSNAYKILADSLANAGIASVRYDKRGIGKSALSPAAMISTRFDDMVGDAALFAKKIKEDKRFGKVFILGHSEGSLIGMRVANKEKVDGFISLAGAGQRADFIMKKQIAANAPQLSPAADSILISLAKGNTVLVKNPQLTSIFSESVQPYLISWFAYDPGIEIKKLNTKVLLINGSSDLQVDVSEMKRLKTAKPAATSVVIEGMNHVLKDGGKTPEENRAAYNNIDLPLANGLSPAIVNFIRK